MTLRSRSVRIDPDRCSGHMECMRRCPTDAIRVWGGRAQLLPGRCIDCGLCLRACPNGAIAPREQRMENAARFRHRIVLASPALFTQFGCDVGPEQILAALARLGFDEAVDLTPAIDAVLAELAEVVRNGTTRKPTISPFCPTVARLIQVRYPELIEHIAPIESPQELMAAAVREARSQALGLRREQLGIVYLAPCAATAAALKPHTRMTPSCLDSAVGVRDLYGRLRSVLADAPPKAAYCANGVSATAMRWAQLGGQGAGLDVGYTLAVGGLENVIRTLDDVEMGKLQEVDYIECRACHDGCISGSLMIDNPYEARGKLTRLIQKRGSEFKGDQPAVRELRARADIRAHPVVPRRPEPIDPDVEQAMDKMRRLELLFARLPQNNCGACGSPHCRAFAEDVVQGRLEEDDCVFLREAHLRDTVSELQRVLSKLPTWRASNAERMP